MSDTTNTSTPRKKRRRHMPRKWLLIPLLLLGLWLLATRTFVTRWTVLSVVEAVTGTRVTAASLRIDAFGNIVARDVRLRNPKIKGTAGEILSVGKLHANIGVPALLQGRLFVQSLSLDEPIVRVSVAESGDGINFAGLSLPEGKREGIKRLPRIDLRRGVIELGEHKPDGSYTALKRLDVAGEVLESLVEGGDSAISFRQIESSSADSTINVRGTVGSKGLTIALDGVSLSPFPVESVPSAFRERFRELALEGGVGALRISLGEKGRIEGRLEVTGVDLNLPIKPRASEDEDGNVIPVPESQRDKPLRMLKTNGTITITARNKESGKDTLDATLAGFVEDLPYQVRLSVDGVKENSPFVCELTCKGFELRTNPQLIRYTPAVAQRRYAQFSNPTGTVDATVTIQRGSPTPAGEPGEVTVSGVIDVRDGSAAFERFPYRFYKMEGRWRFDDAKVVIESLRGEAPSGAKIVATGVISPINESAAVTINVEITDLPIDETLNAAMGGNRGKIITALFNKPRYAQLVIDGLVVPSADAETQPASSDGPPVFDLGGRVNVKVVVQRDPTRPEGDRWTDVIDIFLPKVGVVPEKFPYPMIAEGVRIIKRNDDATVEGGTWRGLRGGTATTKAYADLIRLEDPDLPFCPDITINAVGVPLDDLFLHAVPDSSESMGEGQSPRALLTALGVRGTMNCDVKIGLTPEGEEGYDANATLAGAVSSPLSGDGKARVVARGLTGKVRVTQDSVHADLSGSLHPAGDISPAASSKVGSSIHVVADVQYGDGSAKVLADVDSPKFDAALMVEDFVRIFSLEGEAEIQGLRSSYKPDGAARLGVRVERAVDGDTKVAITASELALSLTAMDSRVAFSDCEGMVFVEPGLEGRAGVVRFDTFQCSLATGADSPGRLAASGAIRTDGLPLDDQTRFNLSLHHGHFENPLVASSLGSALGERALRQYRTLSPRGVFDLVLNLTPETSAGGAARWSTTGVLRPASFAFKVGETPIAFVYTDGEVVFTPNGGSLNGVVLEAPDWFLTGEGTWTNLDPNAANSGGIRLDAGFTLLAQGLPASLQALLPAELLDVFDQLKFEAWGEVALSDAVVTLMLPADENARTRVRTTGHATVSGAQMDLGLELTDCDAAIDYSFSTFGDAKEPDFELFLASDRLKVNGVHLVNTVARVQGGQNGEVFIPIIAANAHGGRIAGSAMLSARDSVGRREFTTDFRASDVRFASVVTDLKTAEDADAAGERYIPPGERVDEVLDESRGRLAAEVSIGGIIGEPASRRGRGSARVNGGSVVSIPLVVPLIRASNLQLPISEKLDFARAAFYMEAGHLNFEELLIASKSVGIYGYGAADFPGAALDLRIRLRNTLRIPLLTTLIENLRDQLFSFRVRGTLGDPKTEVIPFEGAAKLLERAMGGTRSEQERRLDQIERAAEKR